jgi:hypothetical protein
MRTKIAAKVMILKEGSMMSTGKAKPRLDQKLISMIAKTISANDEIVLT